MVLVLGLTRKVRMPLLKSIITLFISRRECWGVLGGVRAFNPGALGSNCLFCIENMFFLSNCYRVPWQSTGAVGALQGGPTTRTRQQGLAALNNNNPLLNIILFFKGLLLIREPSAQLGSSRVQPTGVPVCQSARAPALPSATNLPHQSSSAIFSRLFLFTLFLPENSGHLTRRLCFFVFNYKKKSIMEA